MREEIKVQDKKFLGFVKNTIERLKWNPESTEIVSELYGIYYTKILTIDNANILYQLFIVNENWQDKKASKEHDYMKKILDNYFVCKTMDLNHEQIAIFVALKS